MKIFMVIIALVLGGCAAKPTESFQSSNNLTITLSKNGKGQYRLVDKNNREVARATSKSKELRFPIPDDVDAGECFSVVDRKGKLLGDKRYALPIVDKYRALEFYRVKLEKEVKEYIDEGRVRNEEMRNILNRLNGVISQFNPASIFQLKLTHQESAFSL